MVPCSMKSKNGMDAKKNKKQAILRDLARLYLGESRNRSYRKIPRNIKRLTVIYFPRSGKKRLTAKSIPRHSDASVTNVNVVLSSLRVVPVLVVALLLGEHDLEVIIIDSFAQDFHRFTLVQYMKTFHQKFIHGEHNRLISIYLLYTFRIRNSSPIPNAVY